MRTVPVTTKVSLLIEAKSVVNIVVDITEHQVGELGHLTEFLERNRILSLL